MLRGQQTLVVWSDLQMERSHQMAKLCLDFVTLSSYGEIVSSLRHHGLLPQGPCISSPWYHPLKNAVLLSQNSDRGSGLELFVQFRAVVSIRMLLLGSYCLFGPSLSCLKYMYLNPIHLNCVSICSPCIPLSHGSWPVAWHLYSLCSGLSHPTSNAKLLQSSLVEDRYTEVQSWRTQISWMNCVWAGAQSVISYCDVLCMCGSLFFGARKALATWIRALERFWLYFCKVLSVGLASQSCHWVGIPQLGSWLEAPGGNMAHLFWTRRTHPWLISEHFKGNSF